MEIVKIELKLLNIFFFRLYGHKNVYNVNEVRLSQFLKSYSINSSNQSFKKSVINFDASLIPPCKSELFQQLMRVSYVRNIWCNANLQYPSNIGNPDNFGWILSDDFYIFHWFDGDVMPNTINEIVLDNEVTEEDANQLSNDEESKYEHYYL